MHMTVNQIFDNYGQIRKEKGGCHCYSNKVEIR